MTQGNGPQVPVEDLLTLAGPRQEPSPAALAQARAAAHEAWGRARNEARRRNRLRWGVAGLASAAAAVLLLVALGRRDTSPVEQPITATLASATGVVATTTTRAAAAPVAMTPGDAIRVDQIVVTDATSRARLTLASGPEVRLDVGTRVRFDGAARLELLEGALFVDTGTPSASSSALVIATRFGEAHDVGTRFEVRLSTNALRIRVRDGMVRLVRSGSSETAGRAEELLAAADGAVTRDAFASSEPAWAWITQAIPPLAIDGIELRAFLSWAERESGRRIRFASVDLARRSESIVLHGSIAGLTPQEAIEVVLASCGLSSRIAGDEIIIDTRNASSKTADRRRP